MQDELPNPDHVPTAQERHGSSPAAVVPRFPAGQIFLQFSNLVLPTASVEEPVGHLMHDVAPVEFEKCPCGHIEHGTTPDDPKYPGVQSEIH